MINRAVFMHRPFCFEYCAEPPVGAVGVCQSGDWLGKNSECFIMGW